VGKRVDVELAPDLVAWADRRAKQRGVKRAAVFEEALRHLRDHPPRETKAARGGMLNQVTTLRRDKVTPIARQTGKRKT
jgi:hypothetical protein